MIATTISVLLPLLLVLGLFALVIFVIAPRLLRHRLHSRPSADPRTRAERDIRIARLTARYDQVAKAGDIAEADQLEAEIRELKNADLPDQKDHA